MIVPRTNIFNKVDNVFTCRDGKVIHSISRLALALDNMSSDEFSHHVTSDKNDFAAWVSDCCQASELAQKMGAMKDQKELTNELNRFVVQNLKLH